MVVSVIIPTYNGSRFIGRTIDSVLHQSMVDLELIIINDGSTDDTIDVINRYLLNDRRVRVIQQDNMGIARARNRGLDEVHKDAKYIMCLDHDDTLEADAILHLYECAEDNHKSVGAHGLARIVDAKGMLCSNADEEKWLQERYSITERGPVLLSSNAPTSFSVEIYWNRILTMGQVLLRKSALDSVGGFDSRAVPCDDWDMYLRLTRMGVIAYINEVVVNWRRHERNTSGNVAIMDTSQRYVRNKAMSCLDLSERNRNIADLAFRYVKKDIVSSRFKWAKEAFMSRHYFDGCRQLRHAMLTYLSNHY